MLIALGLCPLHASAQVATPTPASAAISGDVLRAGDGVRLKIWREPDLSGEFIVDEAGKVVFPKLGPLQVTTISPDSLRTMLVASYSLYLVDPAIEVTLLRRVNVQGAVQKPGLYAVDPTMTVADALALAGGATSEGKADKVELLRDGRKLTVDLSRKTRLSDTPILSGDQLFVPQRGWFSRNTTVVAAGITALTTVAVALLVR